jgi:hypothetical protein
MGKNVVIIGTLDTGPRSPIYVTGWAWADGSGRLGHLEQIASPKSAS